MQTVWDKGIKITNINFFDFCLSFVGTVLEDYDPECREISVYLDLEIDFGVLHRLDFL